MAVPTFHITNDDSSTTTGYSASGPGTLIMDADAFLYMPGILVELDGGPWTATINGKINWSPSPNVSFALYLADAGAFRSSVTIGTTGELAGYDVGVLADHATDIVNKGTIINASTFNGTAISESGNGDYKIVNSGTIAGVHGISLTGTGTHSIVNSGSIEATTVILASGGGVEKVTNSGVMIGDIDLGNNADSFTDFTKVKVKGKFVTKHGTVDGTIDLGDGSDSFNGGNNAETVQDGNGADSYKLGGDNDTLVAASTTGSDGVDSIDGGSGVDTYDAGLLTTALIINLDTKAHGGAAANSVVNGQTDHIFNVEDVIGTEGSDVIYGNAAANHIVGYGPSALGADQIFGFGGNDVLESRFRGSQLFGGDGDDTLLASQNCYLEGGNGNDILEAGAGSSDLYGGAGADILTGGDFQGAGTIEHFFRYKALSDSGVTAATRDRITTFHSGGGDFIDLSEIDADTTASGLQSFIFSGLSKWHHTAGELRYVWTLTQTIVEADVDGDAKADFSVALDGHHALTADDFIGVPVTTASSPGTLPATNHITNDNSGSYGATNALVATGPGNLLMDADAWLLTEGTTIVLQGGSWTGTIDGKVTTSNFSGGGNAAIYLYAAHSSLTIGASADITGYTWGIFSELDGTDIVNKGNIVSESATGFGIRELAGASFTINNSGTITAANVAIDLTFGSGSGGTRTIINSGTIDAPSAIENFTGVTKLTNTGIINGVITLAGQATLINSGVITGDVSFGGGNDTFTNFSKIKIKGKFVTKQGTVDGTITFADGDDHFNGGNNAETVQDGRGGDVFKLGGGDDIFLASTFSTSEGNDIVDGGTGRDTYDFSSKNTAFVVNLDTKAHGSAPANTATFISGIAGRVTEQVFNFEDVLAGSQGDTIYGNAAANHLSGGDGDDALYGFAGNDFLEGNLLVDAGHGNDFLYGGAGNDVLDGGGGADHLYGESGRDIITGGTGDGQAGPTTDIFVFSSLSDSGVTAATRDVITDFNLSGDTDKIDLSEIDAVKGTPANEDFIFIGFSKWHHQSGELRYVLTSTQTVVEADVNGDAKADFSVALDGQHTLTTADFIGVF